MFNKIAQIPYDKLLHFVAGMLITACVAIFPGMENIAFVGAIVAGIAKEVRDKITYGGYDWKDLAATIAGGVIMQLFIWLIN